MKTSLMIAAIVVLVLVTAMVLPALTGQSYESSAQSSGKSLDITRHANEPLELIDIKVSERSVKNKIRVKYRKADDPRDGLDRLEFQDDDDWLKRLRIKLRNVSGKLIVGLQAYLYFKPRGSQILFSVSLNGSKQLEHTTISPGNEIEIMVDSGSFERAINRLNQYGWDAKSAEVTFSVEIVAFGDGLQWRKGHKLRVDPDNPTRRIPIETKRPSGLSRLTGLVQFRTIAFRPDEVQPDRSWGKSVPLTLTRRPPQANARCVLDNGSYQAAYCVNDPMSAWCYTITDLGAGQGTASSVQVIGDCARLPGPVDPGVDQFALTNSMV